MNLNEIQEMQENQLPGVKYHEFQRIMEESADPEYSLIRDANLSIEEINLLQKAEDQEEYREFWSEIEAKRKEQKEEQREYQQRFE